MIHSIRLLVLLPVACMLTLGHSAAQAQEKLASVAAVPAEDPYSAAMPGASGTAPGTPRTTPTLAERPQSLSGLAAAHGSLAGDPWSERLPLSAALPGDTIAPWPWGWMARGLVGGLVAGPIGAAVAYNMIGRGDPGSALDERIRARRKEAVVVGGMLGTAVLAIVLLRVIDLDGESQGNGGGPGPEPA